VNTGAHARPGRQPHREGARKSFSRIVEREGAPDAPRWPRPALAGRRALSDPEGCNVPSSASGCNARRNITRRLCRLPVLRTGALPRACLWCRIRRRQPARSANGCPCLAPRGIPVAEQLRPIGPTREAATRNTSPPGLRVDLQDRRRQSLPRLALVLTNHPFFARRSGARLCCSPGFRLACQRPVATLGALDCRRFVALGTFPRPPSLLAELHVAVPRL